MLSKPLLASILILALAAVVALPTSAAITVVHNPQQAPLLRTIPMVERWRIGAGSDEPFVFGVINQVISDESGNFYLLDSQQSEVFKFSPDGRLLKSVARKGEGPGELGRCYFFGFWDSTTIACFSSFPHKFIRFDLDGIPAATLTPTPGEAQKNDGRIALNRFIRRDGHLVAQGSYFLLADGQRIQKSFLSGFDDDALETTCFGKQLSGHDFRFPVLIDEEADFIPHRRWTLGLGGEVYTAPRRTEYLIEVRDASGVLLRTISRDWPVPRRTDEEKEAVKNRYIFGVGSNTTMPDISFKIADHPEAITSLNWVDDQLWVIPTAMEPAGSRAGVFEVSVFDGAGELREDRIYQLPWDPENDRVFWCDGGRAVVVRNYESARVASRSSGATYQRGDGQEEHSFTDDDVLEVILYEAGN